MAPFRELISKETPFYWDDTLQAVFEWSKAVIIESIQDGVRSFSINRTTCLATDWSKTGIGFTYLKSIANVPERTHSVAQTTGMSYTQNLDLPAMQRVAMLPLKVRLLPCLWASKVVKCSFWDVRIY